MRVGFLIYGDINEVSGGYLYDRKLVDYLRRQGDTVNVISLEQTTYWRALLNKTVPDALLNEQYDVLIQDELIHASMLRINKRLRKMMSCPVVALVHLLKSSVPNPAWKRALFGKVERCYLLGVDGLVLNSRDTLTKTRQLMSDVPPHVVAVPCGNNFTKKESEAAAADKSSADALALLYVGAITEQKGLHVLLDALAAADARNMTLTITGRQDLEPGYAASIRRRIRKLALAERVHLTGPLGGQELVQAYKRHDVLVLPSVNEAYGIVYLEAQQFGLPVIGTTIGGAKEIIEHGKSGYLIEPADSGRLAEILDSLHKDRALLKSLGAAALDNYRRQPVWDETCRTIRQFLLPLAARDERTDDMIGETTGETIDETIDETRHC